MRPTSSFGNRVPADSRRQGGARLRSARRAIGLSSAALSDLLPADMRVSSQAIRAYEAGKNAPSIPMARLLEELLLERQTALPALPSEPLRRGELCRLYGFDDPVAAEPDRLERRLDALEQENTALRDRIAELERRLDPAR